jgi:hypothetical protein|tara:strand:- start:2782 stop:3000 length:219 start_codon:yes stop_codon:yes gene_type:complete
MATADDIARSNELAITEIKGEVKLIHNRIDVIENNHLVHIEKSVASINKVLWTIGVIIFSHFVFAIRTLLLG